MIKRIITFILITGIAGSFTTSLSGQDKPNIILFLIDDGDTYQFGCFGGPVYTPNIDQLAEEGMMFHNAHVNSTVCTPSRYSLTTGKYAGRSEFADYLEEYPEGSQGHPEFNVGLEHNFMNIGYAMNQAGYKTGWVGKYHLHADHTLQGGLTREEKQFLKNDASKEDPLATELFRQQEQAYREYIVNKGFSWAKHIYEGNLNNPFKTHNLEWTIEAALDFIDSADNEPFYLHFNTTLLHGPDGEWERSMQYPEETGEGLIERTLDANMPDRSTVIDRIESNGYNLDDNPAGITWLDDGVGAVMDKLDSLGIAENTIFVFMPDHGSANKASLYSKHGTNIPLIIRYPEGIAPGTETSSLVQALDLIPTFYELGGVELPDEYKVDGSSLAPLFEDPSATIHGSLYFELGCARAVITEDYKYIAKRYTQNRIQDILSVSEDQLKDQIIRKLIYLDGHVGISARGIKYNPEYLSPDQLYDVETDPAELNNLAKESDYQDELEAMKDTLKKHLEKFPDRPFGEFIPGPNASAPNPDVLDYIRNIQYALRHGATLNRGELVCEGNCVISGGGGDTTYTGEEGFNQVKIFQDNDFLLIVPGSHIREMKLYDMGGRVVSNVSLKNREELVLNKSRFRPGMYLLSLQLDHDQQIHCQKVLIQ